MSVIDRVQERRRAVAAAREYREREGLTIAEIATRLGRAPGTVKGYLYDPTGEKARRLKARYRGVCRRCGAPTASRQGQGDAYEYCKRCQPGRPREWTRERVRDSMRSWRERYGTAPSSNDWSRTRARKRGGEALRRLQEGDWPAPATVADRYGSWAAARADAFPEGLGPSGIHDQRGGGSRSADIAWLSSRPGAGASKKRGRTPVLRDGGGSSRAWAPYLTVT